MASEVGNAVGKLVKLVLELKQKGGVETGAFVMMQEVATWYESVQKGVCENVCGHHMLHTTTLHPVTTHSFV